MLGLVRISVNCQRISYSVIHLERFSYSVIRLERLSEVEKWYLSMADCLDITKALNTCMWRF
jgi:hypothetical protein